MELISPSDRLPEVQAKMAEWIANGAMLGWILDGEHRRVHIYRAIGDVEVLEGVNSIQGEGPLATFQLDLSQIWEPGL